MTPIWWILLSIGGLVLLALALGFGLAIGDMSSRSRKRREWSVVARQRGLRYRSDAGYEGIDGRLEGHPVRVRVVSLSGGASEPTYRTRFELHFRDPLGLGLTVRRAGLMQGVARLLGAGGVEVGESGFDRSVAVHGSSEGDVREFLTAARRRGLEEFLDAHPGASITDRGIELERPGMLDGEAVDAGLRDLASIAGILFAAPLPGARAELQGPPPAPEPRPEPTETEARRPHARPPPPRPPADRGPSEASSLPGPSERPPSSAEPTGDAVSEGPFEAVGVARTLFHTGLGEGEIAEVFRRRFQGREARARGEIRGALRLSSDPVFGQAPFTRLTIVLPAPADAPDLAGAVELHGKVDESAESLRRRIWETVTLRGRLVACDVYGRSLYLDEAEMEAEEDAEDGR